MPYGPLELAYAEPFANALSADASFREWLIGRTRFASVASGARLLHEEMKAKRSKVATNWWRSHFTEKCRCPGCSGQETDLLAVFETPTSNRFALHIEIKHPGDKFSPKRDQAGNYALRAACWVKAAPDKVLPHKDASTMLLCSESRLSDFAIHLPKFGSVVTFEDVAAVAPHATPTTTEVAAAAAAEVARGKG